MTFSLSRQLSPTFRKLRDLSIYCGVYSRVALEPLATPHMYAAWPSACQHPKGYTTHCQDLGANRVSLSLRKWSWISEV